MTSLVFVFQAVIRVQGGPKIKPLQNYQNIVLNRIETCQRDSISSSN